MGKVALALCVEHLISKTMRDQPLRSKFDFQKSVGGQPLRFKVFVLRKSMVNLPLRSKMVHDSVSDWHLRFETWFSKIHGGSTLAFHSIVCFLTHAFISIF